MTGYQSKRAAAQAKMVQWANEAFNDWWNNDYDDSTNPYEKDTFAYWAWAGWQAALAQPEQKEKFCDSNCVWTDHHPNCNLAQSEQEPVAWMKASPTEWSISFFKEDGYVPLYTIPPQRTWVGLTEEQRINISYKANGNECVAVELTEAKLKELNT